MCLRRVEMYKTTISLVAVLFLSGCYPIYKTQKLELEVSVVDEHNQPIAMA